MSIEQRITTVTTPATTFDLTTLIDVKGDLSLTAVSGIEGARLARRISQCSALAATYCNRVFAKQTYRDTLRTASYEPFIILAHCPIISISAVTIDDDDPLTAADYELDADAGFLYSLDGDDARSEWYGGKIVVDYVAGFVLPGMAGTRTLPHDIEDAVIRMVRSRQLALQVDTSIRSEEVVGVGSITYAGASLVIADRVPPDVAAMLDPYRLPIVL